MDKKSKKYTTSLKGSLAMYNMVPNLFWSILNLLPISVFCYRYLDLIQLIIFVGISLLTILLPKSFFDRTRISKKLSVYRKFGVHHVNKFTQNGTIIYSILRKKYPDFKGIAKSKQSINKLLRQSYMFEKFHFMLFVFFSIIILFAIILHFYSWAVIILINNIIYNVYPNWFQQYIRLRISGK